MQIIWYDSLLETYESQKILEKSCAASLDLPGWLKRQAIPAGTSLSYSRSWPAHEPTAIRGWVPVYRKPTTVEEFTVSNYAFANGRGVKIQGVWTSGGFTGVAPLANHNNISLFLIKWKSKTVFYDILVFIFTEDNELWILWPKNWILNR